MKQRNSWHSTRYAYHEAGHAVVGHVLGRLIAELSILSENESGYKGYCAFDAFTESANDHNEWQNDSSNSDLLTIMYAGTIAMSMICMLRGWNYERWRGCDRGDFDYIYTWSLNWLKNEEQRYAVQEECRQQAQKILEEYAYVVDEIAGHLLTYGYLSGAEVHEIIWRVIGEKDTDWRTLALGV